MKTYDVFSGEEVFSYVGQIYDKTGLCPGLTYLRKLPTFSVMPYQDLYRLYWVIACSARGEWKLYRHERHGTERATEHKLYMYEWRGTERAIKHSLMGKLPSFGDALKTMAEDMSRHPPADRHDNGETFRRAASIYDATGEFPSIEISKPSFALSAATYYARIYSRPGGTWALFSGPAPYINMGYSTFDEALSTLSLRIIQHA